MGGRCTTPNQAERRAAPLSHTDAYYELHANPTHVFPQVPVEYGGSCTTPMMQSREMKKMGAFVEELRAGGQPLQRALRERAAAAAAAASKAKA